MTTPDWKITEVPGYVIRVRAERDASYADWELYECVGHETWCEPSNSKNWVLGPPQYERKGGTGPMDSTEDVDEAVRTAYGSTKWDGCSNFLFDDRDAMMHMCGKKDIAALGAALVRCYELAAEAMPERYNRELGEE